MMSERCLARATSAGRSGWRRLAGVSVMVLGTGLGAAVLAQDEGVISAEQIERSLRPSPAAAPPASPAPAAAPATRGLTRGLSRGIERVDKAPATDAPVAEAPAAEPPRIDVRILFRTNSDAIDQAAAAPQLAQVARALQSAALRDSHIRIEGHTDSVGAAAYNLTLSERRARSVKRHLTELGVPATRLHALGKGEAEPVADNASAAGRARNRRVTLINLGASGPGG